MADFYIVSVGDKEVHVSTLGGKEVSLQDFKKIIGAVPNLMEGDVPFEKIAQLLSDDGYKFASELLAAAQKRGIDNYRKFQALSRADKKALIVEAGYKPSYVANILSKIGGQARRFCRQNNQ
jgi:hypothetical protein